MVICFRIILIWRKFGNKSSSFYGEEIKYEVDLEKNQRKFQDKISEIVKIILKKEKLDDNEIGSVVCGLGDGDFKASYGMASPHN